MPKWFDGILSLRRRTRSDSSYNRMISEVCVLYQSVNDGRYSAVIFPSFRVDLSTFRTSGKESDTQSTRYDMTGCLAMQID